MGFWGFGVLGFWGFGVLGFWGFGVLGFGGFGVLGLGLRDQGARISGAWRWMGPSHAGLWNRLLQGVEDRAHRPLSEGLGFRV